MCGLLLASRGIVEGAEYVKGTIAVEEKVRNVALNLAVPLGGEARILSEECVKGTIAVEEKVRCRWAGGASAGHGKRWLITECTHRTAQVLSRPDEPVAPAAA